jgi:Domain of unknown function (DUF5916)/Carbohydrate family 9 binding domain-like
LRNYFSKKNSMFKIKITLLLFVLGFCVAHTQVPIKPQDLEYSIKIKKAKDIITLDGKLDETDWKTADVSTPFWESIPYDDNYAKVKTETRVTFDDNNIYVGAKCYQKKGSYVVLSLKRDFGPGTTDLVGVVIDPFGDKQNAFSFAVSPYGVQREGLISNGNEFSTDWDNRWTSKVETYDDYWIAEIAIPFKTLRYKTDSKEWNINFLRYDQSIPVAERSTWAWLPRFASGNNVAFTGKLIWETPPPKAGSNIALIPYVLGSATKDYISNKPQNTEGGLGFDAKVALGSALNLDLTVNPDFAQVEVDKQVTNLSRFELSFPERRQFFLENADLFGNFGLDNINPMFSRRIGLATDKNNNTVKVPILAGARLSGKLDKNWRIGLMNIQTGAQSELKLPATNFLAASIQRKLFSRSLLAFVFVNKQNFNLDTLGNNTWETNPTGYNRVAGLDYNLASKNGRWQGKFFYHHAITPNPEFQPFATAANLVYNNTNFNFSSTAEMVGKGYKAEVGFVPRTNYYRFQPNAAFVFYPKSKTINSWSVGFMGDIRYRNDDNKLTDWSLSPMDFNMFFQSNARLSISPLRWDYTFLPKDFDPTNTKGKPLLAGTAYTYSNTRFNFLSNTRKPFYVNVTGGFGQYFNGKIQQIQTVLSYRYQPYGIFSIDATYSNIALPEGYNSAKLWLVGPKMDLSFTKNVFLTTLLQYNNQSNNVNLNARFQWRFAPVSDLFIVYTDNYFAVDDFTAGFRTFQSKNRGLVLKCTYWLNI